MAQPRSADTGRSYDTSVDEPRTAVIHRLESAERHRRRAGIPIEPTDDGRNDEKVVAMWLHGKADSTKRKYMATARDFLAFVRDQLGDDVGLPLVTLHELIGYAETLSELAAATQVQKMATVKSLLTFAHQIRYCEQNVGAMFNLPKVKDQLHERILRLSEVDRLIRAAPEGRDQVILELLYKTGIRAGEIEQLRWKDFNESFAGDVVVTVHGKGTKTRRVLVSPSAWAALLSIQPEGYEAEDAVFPSRKGGNPLGQRQIRRILTKAAKKANLPEAISPHWMRHAHATHAIDAGVPINVLQKELGHTSLVTTSKYVHVQPDQGSGAALDERLDRLRGRRPS